MSEPVSGRRLRPCVLSGQWAQQPAAESSGDGAPPARASGAGGYGPVIGCQTESQGPGRFRGALEGGVGDQDRPASICQEPDEPAKEHVVVQLFHQHPLAADGIEHLQQDSPPQPLGSNRRSSHLRVQLVKARQQLVQDLVDHLANRPQRVIGRDPLLLRDIQPHPSVVTVVSAPGPRPPSSFDDYAVAASQATTPGRVSEHRFR